MQDSPEVACQAFTDEVKPLALPLTGVPGDYEELLDLVGNARIVMLGEASHGTHEFYEERARISRRLIDELGFSAVAVEGDWPEARTVHHYVTGGEGTAREALAAFSIFPSWMWANHDILDFVEWLRSHNDRLPAGGAKVGFYGLDLFSPYRSMETLLDSFVRLGAPGAASARRRFARFEPFAANDYRAYDEGMAESCQAKVEAMLAGLQPELQRQDRDAYHDFLQSASAALAGEAYYRLRHENDVESWNGRDTHMANALDVLLDHLGPGGKVVLWQHNSHIGDFRATDSGGRLNVGQLVRERHPGESIAIGFGTYEGTVTAAAAPGAESQTMAVPPAAVGSFDEAFHGLGLDRFLLLLKPLRTAGQAGTLGEWRGQRAIGAANAPEKDADHYTRTRLADRYDAYIHIDRTSAVEPL